MSLATHYSGSKVLSRGAAGALVDRLSFTLPILLVAMVFSALSVIYISNEVRSMSAGLQHARAERIALHMEWEQLTLEKSTLIMQARVQRFAENRLGMTMPDVQSVVDVPG